MLARMTIEHAAAPGNHDTADPQTAADPTSTKPSMGQPTARGILKAAGIGAVAGTIGTLAMSALMLPATWLGILGTQPPRRITDRMVDAGGSGWRTRERERRIGTALVHLGIGVGAGAALGIARELGIAPRLTPVKGLAIGSAFWAINYIGIAPALGMLPRPDRDRPGRPQIMLAANALFGAVTATIIEAAHDGRAVDRRSTAGPRRGGASGSRRSWRSPLRRDR